MLRYASTAGALGLGWFAVLLIPGLTREWLLDNVPQNVACLTVASVVVALGGRRFIQNADTPVAHLVRAAVMPYAGCLVFLSLTAALLWARSLLSGGLANLHDTISLFVMGLTATTVSFFVIGPYGLLCQVVMHHTATHTGRSPE